MLDPKWLRFYGIMSGVAVMKAILILGGYYVGAWADKQLGTSPYLAVLFLCVGAGLGICWVLIVMKNTRL
jgi:hypothetical protein